MTTERDFTFNTNGLVRISSGVFVYIQNAYFKLNELQRTSGGNGDGPPDYANPASPPPSQQPQTSGMAHILSPRSVFNAEAAANISTACRTGRQDLYEWAVGHGSSGISCSGSPIHANTGATSLEEPRSYGPALSHPYSYLISKWVVFAAC